MCLCRVKIGMNLNWRVMIEYKYSKNLYDRQSVIFLPILLNVTEASEMHDETRCMTNKD